MPEDVRRTPIEIGWDELNSAEVTAQVNELRLAQAAPLVRSVGTPVSTGAWWRGTIVSLAVAGVIGGLLSWALEELIARPDSDAPWYGSSHWTGAVVFTLMIGTGLGLTLACWDGITARSAKKAWAAALKALPVLAAGGIVGGLIAQKVFETVMTGVVSDAVARAASGASDAELWQFIQDRSHFPRAIGFSIIGIAVGVAVGAASRSKRRAINGAVGGFVGGFVGGYLFDYMGSGVSARVVALAVTGVMVGVAMGLVEQVRREHWIEIVSGGMAGKQFILYHDATTVGSGADCHITLIKDPAMAPRQLLLQRGPGGLTARSLDPANPVLVNGQPISETTLVDAALVQIGTTVLRYRDKQQLAPVAGPIAG